MAEHQILKQGNFKSHSASPYSAYTGMWGHYRAGDLQAESSILLFPSTFPDGTIFTWDVTPSRAWGGVNGFLHVAYGNYDDSPGKGTPRQVAKISNLAATIDWTFEGDPASGLLCEAWLTSKAAPTGPLTKTHEVGFLPKMSASSADWVRALPPVGKGTFTDSYGVAWNVCVSGRYFIAYRPGCVDFRGTLRFDDFFRFLIASGKATGDEWFNGLAFGVEPHCGAGSLTVGKFAVSYT